MLSPCVYYAVIMMVKVWCGVSGQPALRRVSTHRRSIKPCHWVSLVEAHHQATSSSSCDQRMLSPALLCWYFETSLLFHRSHIVSHYAVVTCKIGLFQYYFSGSAFVNVRLRYFHFSAWKLAWNYFIGLLQLMTILRHVHCRWNNF